MDHTAELELEIEAASEADVLGEALRALSELLVNRRQDEAADEGEHRRVEVRAGDRPALLAGWLEELVFLAEMQGFVARRATHIELAEDSVRAEVVGHLGEPPPLVKAVTYHRLVFEGGDDGYRARVVLDV